MESLWEYIETLPAWAYVIIVGGFIASVTLGFLSETLWKEARWVKQEKKFVRQYGYMIGMCLIITAIIISVAL